MRLLIVKFSSIGDCVMAVPVASRVRRALPNAFIGWAVDPRCADVLDTDRLLDLRYDIPWEAWKKEKVGPIAQLRHYLRLREFKFDVGLDLQGHSKTAICLRLSGAAKRYSARATDGFARLLNPLAPTRGAVHTVERNLETLAAAFESDADATPIMPELASVSGASSWRRNPYGNGAASGSNPAPKLGMVTIAVGTGHPKKVYARWGEVAELLVAKGVHVAFVGGPGEVAPDLRGTTNLVGKLSLKETMQWIVSSRAHVAADTGSGHIAAAYGVPVVSVFGWTDPAVYRPYGERVTVLDAGKQMTALEPTAIVEAACAF